MHGIAGWERRRRVSSEAGEPGNRPGRFKMILVTGALGNIGSPVVEKLVELRQDVRVLVRDNGCGIDPCAAQTRRESHWGLLGMRERAESIGAKLTIWSRPGAGTEVEISVPSQTLAEACA